MATILIGEGCFELGCLTIAKNEVVVQLCLFLVLALSLVLLQSYSSQASQKKSTMKINKQQMKEETSEKKENNQVIKLRGPVL